MVKHHLFSAIKLLFTGPPGVGKGTYASRISHHFSLPHISAGDLLRAEVSKASDLGVALESYLSKGLLAPSALVNQIIFKRLREDDCVQRGFILDGFPRNLVQAREFHESENIRFDAVINFHQHHEVIVSKLAGRRMCSSCGTGYNLAHVKYGKLDLPPMLPKVSGTCDACGGTLIQRADDNVEVIRKRLQVYEESTEPMLAFYRESSHFLDFDVDGAPSHCMPHLIRAVEHVANKPRSETMAA